MTDNRQLRVKRVIAVVSAILFLALLGFLTWFVLLHFTQIASAESFRDYIRSFGIWSYAVGFAVQIMQVFIAFIPGEAVEIGMGYAFGALMGTLICYAGVAAASMIILLTVGRFGTKAVSLFVSEEQLHGTGFIGRYIGDTKRLKRLIFILFFIPGTPKDLLTYVFALTPIKRGEFMAISLIARFPSVISSTVGGMLIHDKRYTAAVILFAVTAAVSLLGMIGYDRWRVKHNAQKQEEHTSVH